ncbi:MAG: phospholipase D-like domain-containing protein, partial [Anaerolineae bacterium]
LLLILVLMMAHPPIQTTAHRLDNLDNTAIDDATIDEIAWMGTTASTTHEDQVLIEGVLFDGYPTNGPGEAIRLINRGVIPVDLSDWEICEQATPLNCKSIPAWTLSPGQRIWLVDDGDKFTGFFGYLPHAEPTQWIGMNNEGGEVILRDNHGDFVDVLVYESGVTTIHGWAGESVRTYSIDLDQQYQILHRIPDETTGLPLTDTNTAADWMQTPTDAELGRRALYPGWDYLASPTVPLFWPLKVTEPATVTVGVAPDNAFGVVSAALLRAQKTISIEIYTLRNPALIDLLVDKANAGVDVTILLEGSPLGITDEEWQQELNACKLIETAGGKCYFMVSDKQNGRYNRYYYIHAKFAVVDDRWTVISTQNFTNKSLPADNKSDGTAGSRGVIIATNAPAVAERAAQIFAMDCDPNNHRDILRWNTPGYPQYGQPSLAYNPTIPNGISDTIRFPEPFTLHRTFNFEIFTAPEAALRHSDALLGLLARAGKGDRIYAEQLDEPVDWGSHPITTPNLHLEAYIDAARRGATVRILMDSTAYTTTHRNDYTQTVTYVNQIATRERLDLKAWGGSPLLHGIHNKMILVWLADEGGYVHVGSLNGSERSHKANRELILQIQSDKIYAYLERLFITDWGLSHPVYLPLVMGKWSPPEPGVDHVVISEVYYKPDRNGEWVEIYNPTHHPIDIGAYKIGDAELPESFEGMVGFPAGTTIQTGQVIVVAYDGSSVPNADFELYDYNAEIPEMIDYPHWGDPEYDWGLRNEGDQVLLLGGSDQIIDVVVWGDATYTNVVPHPGVDKFSHSLQRYPPIYDTDNCAHDFRSFPTSIGEVIFPERWASIIHPWD